MQFSGQLYFNWVGSIASVSTESGEQFFFEIVQGKTAVIPDEDAAMDDNLRLCNPAAKIKEKPKPLGWLGGLFAPNNDEIATLFAKRLETRKAAPSPSSAAASPARSKTPTSSGPATPSDKVSEVKNIMEENKRKLMERGDHINDVGEKASQLEDQSNEFARNIAKLKAKQEKSWFF